MFKRIKSNLMSFGAGTMLALVLLGAASLFASQTQTMQDWNVGEPPANFYYFVNQALAALQSLFSGSSYPLNPVNGQLFYNSSTNATSQYINGTWVPLGAQGLATYTYAELAAMSALPDNTAVICSDCNVASPCTSGGTGAIAIGQSGADNCFAPGSFSTWSPTNISVGPGTVAITGSGTSGTDQISNVNVNGVFNAKAFGVKGDGVTNDSTKMQNFIDAVCSGTSASKGEIPPGDYLISGTTAAMLQACKCKRGTSFHGAGKYATEFIFENTNTTTSVGLEVCDTEFTDFDGIGFIGGTSSANAPHVNVQVDHDTTVASQFLSFDDDNITTFGAYNIAVIAAGPIYFHNSNIFDQSGSGLTHGIVTMSDKNTIGLTSPYGITMQYFPVGPLAFDGGLIVSGASNHPAVFCDNASDGQCRADKFGGGFYFQQTATNSILFQDNGTGAFSFWDGIDTDATVYDENLVGGNNAWADFKGNVRQSRIYGMFNNVDASVQSGTVIHAEQFLRYSQIGVIGDASTSYSCIDDGVSSPCVQVDGDCLGTSITNNDLYFTQVRCPNINQINDNSGKAVFEGAHVLIGLESLLNPLNPDPGPLAVYQNPADLTHDTIGVFGTAGQTANLETWHSGTGAGSGVAFIGVQGNVGANFFYPATIYNHTTLPLASSDGKAVALVNDAATCANGDNYGTGGGSGGGGSTECWVQSDGGNWRALYKGY